MPTYSLRIAVFVIATAFAVYLAKGNLGWIPDPVLLVIMGAAGLYWLSADPSVRTIATYYYKTETSKLIHPATHQPLRKPSLKIKRAAITVLTVLGVCALVGISLVRYRNHQAVQIISASQCPLRIQTNPLHVAPMPSQASDQQLMSEAL